MNISGHNLIDTYKTTTYRHSLIAWVVLCAIFFVPTLKGHADIPDIPLSADSLAYRTDFRYTITELDSLIRFSPQLRHLEMTIRTRNQKDDLWRNISLHLTFNPLSEDGQKISSWVGFSARIPLGSLFADKSLDESEKSLLITTLRLKTRELMSQRQALLTDLDHTIQQYQTALLKLRKAEVSLSLSEVSTDEILDIKDRHAGHLASIRKTKLAIQLIEDQLLALIGAL